MMSWLYFKHRFTVPALSMNLAQVVGIVDFKDLVFYCRQDKKELFWLAHLHMVFFQMLSQQCNKRGLNQEPYKIP